MLLQESGRLDEPSLQDYSQHFLLDGVHDFEFFQKYIIKPIVADDLFGGQFYLWKSRSAEIQHSFARYLVVMVADAIKFPVELEGHGFSVIFPNAYEFAGGDEGELVFVEGEVKVIYGEVDHSFSDPDDGVEVGSVTFSFGEEVC